MGLISKLVITKKEYTESKANFSKAMDVSRASFLQALIFNRKYHFTMYDYFNYKLYNHAKDNPLEFLSHSEIKSLRNLLNNEEINQIFDNKEKAYEVFKKYYKRDLLKVTRDNKDEFIEFAAKHNALIIKPHNLSGGEGIKKINTDNPAEAFSILIEEYNGEFIAEELIVQAEEMAKFHPSSINTLRVYTIRFDDEVLPYLISFRCGLGRSVVDNRNSGGIIGIVDLESGIIKKATFVDGGYIDVHPDTNQKIVGTMIPKYDEAKKFAKEIGWILPENRWIGWDFALSKDGWVIVEGNSDPGFYGYQSTNEEGIYSVLKTQFERLGMLDEFNKAVKR